MFAVLFGFCVLLFVMLFPGWVGDLGMFGLFSVVGDSVVFVLVFYCWFEFVGWLVGTGVAMLVLFLYCCLVSYCFVLASIDVCGYCCLLYLL